MKRFIGVGLSVLSMSAVASNSAQAQENKTPGATAESEETAAGKRASFTDRPFAFGARAGFGTSVGLVGLVAEYSLHQLLVVGAGLGTNGVGPEYGGHARLRPVVFSGKRGRLHALTLEVAASRARYSVFELSLPYPCHGNDCEDPIRQSSWVWWIAGDLGWETRWESGLSLRLAGGLAQMIGASPDCELNGVATPCRESEPAVRRVPTASVTLQYAF